MRPIEPIFESYRWAAMLDPYELSNHVAISEIREEILHNRAVWKFRAHAQEGYDPICACCPLVYSEVSERLEYGDKWTVPAGVTMPDGCEIALDAETGIVVSSRNVGSSRDSWFENEIVSAD